MSNVVTIGFSSCPNDTFIFDAMIHQKIDTEGLLFDVTMADVEELNKMAFQSSLMVTKLSYHAIGYLINKYVLLNAGSALGRNCGPLLLCKKDREATIDTSIGELKIAIPGKFTTANFLLSLAYPNLSNKIEILFSDIEDAVMSGEVDAGLVIHESRFTYAERGLHKISDLGEFWENTSGTPIPLGGIVVKRDLEEQLQQKLDRVLRRSVEYAFKNPNSSLSYVREHAQEMDEKVMKQHIELYVTDYSVDLGVEGKHAIEILFSKAKELSLIPKVDLPLFVSPS